MGKINTHASFLKENSCRKEDNIFSKKIHSLFNWLVKVGKVVIGLTVFIFCLILFGFLANAPLNRVREIQVEGLKYFPEAEVQQELNTFLKHGIVKVTNEEVKKVLEKLPYIEDCSIEKNYDERKLIVHVRESSPYATLFVDDQMFLVSHTGKIIKQIQNVKEVVGPLITGAFRQDDIRLGGYITDDGFWSALEFWYEYNQVPKNKNIQISEIVVEGPENLKVFFDEIPCETRWKKENIKRQVQNFSIALNKVDITRLPCNEYIDMRFNDDIVYK